MAGSEEVFDKAMNEGLSAAWEQNWEKAAKFYRIAHHEFPENLSALTNFGLALFELQDYENALKMYLSAARQVPDDPGLLDKLSLIYERLGRVNEAIKLGLRAAELFLKGRDIEKAVEIYHRIIALDGDNLSAYTRLGFVYERLGRIPDSVRAYLGAACIVQQRGDEEKARQIVQYTVNLMPGSPEAAQAIQRLRQNQPLLKVFIPRIPEGLARTTPLVAKSGTVAKEHARGGLDPISEARQRAMAQLAEFLFASPGSSASLKSQTDASSSQVHTGFTVSAMSATDKLDALIHIGQAIEAQTRGLSAKASESLENAEAAGLHHPAISFTLGFLRAGRDDTAALHHLEEAVNHPEYGLASQLITGKIFADQKKYAEAARAYLQALSLADQATVADQYEEGIRQSYEDLIQEVAGVQDEEKLKRICESVVNQLVRPGWRDLLIKARGQLAIEEDSQMLPVSSILLESRSSQVIEAMERIRNFVAQGFLRTASEEAMQALQYTPTYLPLHLQIADLLIKNGLIQEAAVKYALVGQLYALRGDHRRAIEVYKQVTNISPLDAEARSRLLELLINQGRWDDAVEQHVALARCQYHFGALDQARQTLLDAMNTAKNSSNGDYWSFQILEQLAEMEITRLEWPQALRFYQQMLTIKPDNLPVQERIIEIYYRLGEDQTADNELDKALKKLKADHKSEEGIKLLKMLVEDQPEKPQLRRGLIKALISSGKKGEAANELNALVDFFLASDQSQKAVDILAEIMESDPDNLEVYQATLDRLRSQLL